VNAVDGHHDIPASSRPICDRRPSRAHSTPSTASTARGPLACSLPTDSMTAPTPPAAVSSTGETSRRHPPVGGLQASGARQSERSELHREEALYAAQRRSVHWCTPMVQRLSVSHHVVLHQ